MHLARKTTTTMAAMAVPPCSAIEPRVDAKHERPIAVRCGRRECRPRQQGRGQGPRGALGDPLGDDRDVLRPAGTSAAGAAGPRQVFAMRAVGLPAGAAAYTSGRRALDCAPDRATRSKESGASSGRIKAVSDEEVTHDPTLQPTTNPHHGNGAESGAICGSVANQARRCRRVTGPKDHQSP